MDNESLISDKLRGMIGKEIPSLTQTSEIDRRLVADFAAAVEYPNAAWETEMPSKEAEYKSLTEPPQSILWLRGVFTYRGRLIAPLQSELPPHGLDGGGEYEVYKPVRTGDVITARTKLADCHERPSESRGKLLIITFDTTYTNRKGEVVGRFKHDNIRWK